MKFNKKHVLIISRVSIAALILLAFAVPQSWKLIFHAAGILASTDLEPVKAYIRSFGPLAVIVSFLLMVAQSIAAPFPAFLITLTNAALFGWWRGALLSWSSAMAGAAICFGLARLFGRGLVEKLTGKMSLESIDDFFLRYGARSIVIARLLPFVPFDPVSYAAGLTTMSFIGFFIATGIGQTPATIVYSYFGSTLGRGTRLFFNGLCVMFAVVGITVVAKSMYKRKKQKLKERAENERGE